MFQLTVTADATELVDTRERMVERLREGETKPTVSDVLTRIVASALVRHAPLNAQFVDGKIHRFTAANVGLTMGIGTALALLLLQLSKSVRIILTAGLVLVWSMPAVVAVQVWYWMTNFHNGVLNYALTQAHVGDFFQHDWYATSFSQLAMTTTLIVWAGIPFVVIAVYAGLAQVPGELLEAASIDGARPWRIFWDVTFPIIKPVLLILTSLSIIWDYAVFTQPFLLIGRSHIDASNFLMGIYLYIEAYANSDFGRGAAISLLMLLTVAVMSVFYIRQMIRIGEVR